MSDWRGVVARLQPVVSLVGWLYLTMLLCLAGWLVLAWVALGWRPALVTSADLGSGVRPGDVVVTERQGGVTGGSVVTTVRAADSGPVRVREVTPDGRYDVGRDGDVAPDEVNGIGRLLVPAIGLPLLWLRTGRAELLLSAVIVTSLACLLAVRPALARRRRSDVRGPGRPAVDGVRR